jgi:hypothetical protein
LVAEEEEAEKEVEEVVVGEQSTHMHTTNTPSHLQLPLLPLPLLRLTTWRLNSTGRSMLMATLSPHHQMLLRAEEV